MIWWRIALAVLGVGVAVVVAVTLRDNSHARMAFLELRKLLADRERAKEKDQELKRSATNSLIDSNYHRAKADDAGARAKVIEDEIASQTEDLLQELPDSERVRRFKRRLSIDNPS